MADFDAARRAGGAAVQGRRTKLAEGLLIPTPDTLELGENGRSYALPSKGSHSHPHTEEAALDPTTLWNQLQLQPKQPPPPPPASSSGLGTGFGHNLPSSSSSPLFSSSSYSNPSTSSFSSVPRSASARTSFSSISESSSTDSVARRSWRYLGGSDRTESLRSSWAGSNAASGSRVASGSFERPAHWRGASSTTFVPDSDDESGAESARYPTGSAVLSRPQARPRPRLRSASDVSAASRPAVHVKPSLHRSWGQSISSLSLVLDEDLAEVAQPTNPAPLAQGEAEMIAALQLDEQESPKAHASLSGRMRRRSSGIAAAATAAATNAAKAGLGILKRVPSFDGRQGGSEDTTPRKRETSSDSTRNPSPVLEGWEDASLEFSPRRSFSSSRTPASNGSSSKEKAHTESSGSYEECGSVPSGITSPGLASQSRRSSAAGVGAEPKSETATSTTCPRTESESIKAEASKGEEADDQGRPRRASIQPPTERGSATPKAMLQLQQSVATPVAVAPTPTSSGASFFPGSSASPFAPHSRVGSAPAPSTVHTQLQRYPRSSAQDTSVFSSEPDKRASLASAISEVPEGSPSSIWLTRHQDTWAARSTPSSEGEGLNLSQPIERAVSPRTPRSPRMPASAPASRRTSHAPEVPAGSHGSGTSSQIDLLQHTSIAAETPRGILGTTAARPRLRAHGRTASAAATISSSRRPSVAAGTTSATPSTPGLSSSRRGSESASSTAVGSSTPRALAKRSYAALLGMLSVSNGSAASAGSKSVAALPDSHNVAAQTRSGEGAPVANGGGGQGGSTTTGASSRIPSGGAGGWTGAGAWSSGGGHVGGAGAGGSGGEGGPPPPGGGGSNVPSGRTSPPVQTVFRRLELVGRGAYGAVYRGVHIASGTAVALKVVNLDTPEDDVSDIQREVALLSQLREADQRNVVRYWGCWLKGPELWIVMDFAEGGSVRTLMKSGPIAEKYTVLIVRETLVALAYLHKAGIIHRDIKAANILLTNTGRILLCDFGVAASLASSSIHGKRSTFVGTPYWMAPEVITDGRTYDQSADIWSLGVTVYEIATGNPPYADQEQMRAIMLIPRSKPARLPADGNFSTQMREFVAACLNEEPKERPGAEELSKSKWIKAASKAPNSVLRELIVQYNAWTKSGGMRMSLIGAEADALGEAGNRDSFAFDGRESDDGWEFNTLRSQQMDNYDDFDADKTQEKTIAPPRDHPLLRLFEDANSPAPDQAEYGHGFRPNAAPVAPRSADTQGGQTPTTARPAEFQPSPATSRPTDFQTTANATPTQSSAMLQPATTTDRSSVDKGSFEGSGTTPFRFGASVPRGMSSNAGTMRAERRAAPMLISIPPLDNAGIALEGGISPADTRDMRAMEASQDRKDTSFESSEATATDTSFADTNGNAGHGSNSSSGTSISAHGRTWSQASLAHRRGRSSLSSLSPKGSSSSQSPSMDNGAFQQPSSRRNSANGLAFSGVNTEPKAASAGKVEAPAYMGQALNAPTPLMRSVSAQNVLPDPSQSLINRPSTVAPMDVGVSSSTLAPTEPTSAAGGGYSQLGLGVPPGVSSMARQASQPFAPRSRSASRSRSGSGSALEPVGHQAAGFNLAAMSRNPSATHGLGLKDVLKLSSAASEFAAGNSELLPPSPASASSANARFAVGNNGLAGTAAVNVPSPLGPAGAMLAHQRQQHGGSDPTLPMASDGGWSNVGISSGVAAVSYSQLLATPGIVGTSPSVSSGTAPSDGGISTAGSSVPGSGSGPGSASGSWAARNMPEGPRLRPLDLALLGAKEDVHAELARTIDELGRWLDVLGVGLARAMSADSAV